MRLIRSLPLRPLAAALLLVGSASTLAEGNPWGLGAAVTVTSDSNVLRVPSAQAASDTIVSLGVRLQLDQPLGRERLVLDGSFDSNRFQQQSALDNNSYQAAARLDFEAGDRLFGSAGLESSQASFNYDPNGQSALTSVNLERNARAYLRLRQGVVTQITAEAGLEATERAESDTVFAYRERRRQAMDAGLRYQPTPDLNLKGLLRHARGSYPGLGAGDDFRRTDLEATGTWQASGASALDARLTRSQESHSLSTVRSTSQWSGSVQWRWQPTGKLAFRSRLARDSDTGANDVSVLGNLLNYSDARQRTTLELASSWQPSSKLRLDLQLSESRRALDASLQATGQPSTGSDRSRAARLSLAYQAQRNLELGCSAGREQRSVSGATQGLSYPYGATTTSCYGQAWLR